MTPTELGAFTSLLGNYFASLKHVVNGWASSHAKDKWFTSYAVAPAMYELAGDKERQYGFNR